VTSYVITIVYLVGLLLPWLRDDEKIEPGSEWPGLWWFAADGAGQLGFACVMWYDLWKKRKTKDEE